MMANLVHMITTGVPVRYPQLRVAVYSYGNNAYQTANLDSITAVVSRVVRPGSSSIDSSRRRAPKIPRTRPSCASSSGDWPSDVETVSDRAV